MSREPIQCRKCEKLFYCEKHHILPKSLFGEGETEDLCPNCHDEFHRYLGHKYLRKENKQPMEFYFQKYYRWLYGIGLALIILFLIKF